MAILNWKYAQSSFVIGAASAAVIAQPVMAQTSDSATAEVIADLQVETPPLEVVSTSRLDFGLVNIPNGAGVGNRCSYDLDASNTPLMDVREINSSNGTVDATLPTPSNCASFGNPLPARFAVFCNPATPTTISYSFSGAGPNSVLTASTRNELAVVDRDDTSGPTVQATAGPTLLVTCPDGSNSSLPNSGAFDVLVGGRLLLTEDAVANDAVLLGTLTLEATY